MRNIIYKLQDMFFFPPHCVSVKGNIRWELTCTVWDGSCIWLTHSHQRGRSTSTPPPTPASPCRCLCVSGHLLLPLKGWHSSGEVIKALINRSADVSTHTPQDTKENILRNGLVERVSACDIRVPYFPALPPLLCGVKLLLLHCKRYLIWHFVFLVCPIKL